MGNKLGSYFEKRPDIVKIFDDLDKFRDFCRFELLPFDEKDLYNRKSPIWNQYYYSQKPRKPRSERSGGFRKAHQ